MGRTIAMLVFDRSEILDICGPLDVFAFTNRWLQSTGQSPENAYELSLLARGQGSIPTSSGIRLIADRAYSDVGPNETFDTLMVPGSHSIAQVLADSEMLAWLKATAPRVRRLASVCTGAFMLAAGGLLNGRRATTHWLFCDQMVDAYPEVTVEPNRIYIKDGEIYTSGGVTAGMDLALGLVEEDWGAEVAGHVARFMVLFLRRPGGQSQFSQFLLNSEPQRTDMSELLTWIVAHPHEVLNVEALAERMAMSPRNFARVFNREVGMTPAKFVEQIRVEAARSQLQQTAVPVETIARQCGFGSEEHLRRSFIRRFSVGPREYRGRFHSTT